MLEVKKRNHSEMVFRLISRKIRINGFYTINDPNKECFSFLEATNLIAWPFTKHSIKSSIRPSVRIINRYTKKIITHGEIYIVYERGRKLVNYNNYLSLYPFVLSPLNGIVAIGFANAAFLDTVGSEQSLDPKNFLSDTQQNGINVRYNIAFLALRRLR